MTIPRLGRVRLESLAAAGVTSLDDLRKMSVEDLAAIKWIGLGNAKLIKEWLETNADGATAPEPKPAKRQSRSTKADAPVDEVPAAPKPRARRTKAEDAPAPEPPPAPRTRRPRNTVAQTDPAVVEVSTPTARRTRATRTQAADAVVPAEETLPPVEDIQEPAADALTVDRERFDTAVNRIKEAIPKKSRDKKLGRQLKKAAHSVSELSTADVAAESKAAAAEALDRIAMLLNSAVESGKLSAKKQETVSADLKKFRKKLEKALGS